MLARWPRAATLIALPPTTTVRSNLTRWTQTPAAPPHLKKNFTVANAYMRRDVRIGKSTQWSQIALRMNFLDGAFVQHLVHYGYSAIFLIVIIESAGIPMPGETILVSCRIRQ